MGELREFLKSELPKYKDPIIFISSEFITGCPMCQSDATIYYITLTERNLVPDGLNIEKAENHKFPIDIYVNYPLERDKPKQFVIGTKKSMGELKMILRRVVE